MWEMVPRLSNIFIELIRYYFLKEDETSSGAEIKVGVLIYYIVCIYYCNEVVCNEVGNQVNNSL